MDATVVMGRQGRVVVPADVRRALGIKAGDRLLVRVTGAGVSLEPVNDPVSELRQLAAGVPRSRSLVDELIAGRRAEAADG